MSQAVAKAEDVYVPAVKEVSRRREAAAVECRTQHFETSSESVAFDEAEQRFALVTFGTPVLAPPPCDPARPALRVYGAFPTRDDAAEHGEVVAGLDATVSLLVVPVGAWQLMPATEESLQNPGAAIARRWEAHRAARTAAKGVFEEMVATKSEAPDPRAADEEDTTEEEVYGRPKRIRAGCEVRGQAAVAMSVVEDPEGGECLIKLHGCFENTAQADAWVRNVGSRRETEHDIHVAATCEWLYPNARARGNTMRYRDKELQVIMDAAAKNPDKVKEYRQWKAESDAAEEAAGSLPP